MAPNSNPLRDNFKAERALVHGDDDDDEEDIGPRSAVGCEYWGKIGPLIIRVWRRCGWKARGGLGAQPFPSASSSALTSQIACRAPIVAENLTMAKTVKDVPSHEFVRNYAAHLKRSGKVGARAVEESSRWRKFVCAFFGRGPWWSCMALCPHGKWGGYSLLFQCNGMWGAGFSTYFWGSPSSMVYENVRGAFRVLGPGACSWCFCIGVGPVAVGKARIKSLGACMCFYLFLFFADWSSCLGWPCEDCYIQGISSLWCWLVLRQSWYVLEWLGFSVTLWFILNIEGLFSYFSFCIMVLHWRIYQGFAVLLGA